ncbi:hypothetical protein IWQ54_006469 [Labrenzia sp. EL_195]|nr:hypothetical protein [Labrenzia sp. EL_195]
MILGTLKINETHGELETHNDNYMLDSVTAVSIRRPALAIGVVTFAGIGGFAAVFTEYLYPVEIAVAGGFACFALLLGSQVGQLKLLSRDLRHTDLSGVIWGRYASLRAKRREIVRAIAAAKKREGSQ